MSADNWAICPQCKINAENELEKFSKKLKNSYGKISAEDYELLRSEEPSGEVEEQTLREDFSIGVDEDGFFFLNYSGHCTKCQFKYQEKYNKQILKTLI